MQCKQDREVATDVERWEESYRVLKEQHGMEELGEQYRMTAPRCLLVADIKRHIELKECEIETYRALRPNLCRRQKVGKRKGKRIQPNGHWPVE